MKQMVVLFALAAVACGSLVPLAQPPHHPALVLDPHGRPLDTAEVIGARTLHLQAKALEHGHYAPLVHSYAAPLVHSYAAHLAHSYVAPAAVSHQSRIDVHSSPAVIATHAAPAWGAHAGLLGHSAYGVAGHGHWLKKRSLGHLAYSAHVIAPAHTVYVGGSAVSKQSRVDVVSSPAVVSHAISAPVYHHAAPLVAHVAPAAVSHQSRVDVHSSPALVSHAVVAAPVIAAHSSWAAPAYGAHDWASSHGHLLKKRSLAFAHVVPAAVSHQSRVDVISSPAVVSHAAPIAVAHAAPIAIAHAAPAVSHQSRVDVISTAHVAPIAHSAVWTAPLAHLSHSGLLHSSPYAHAHATHW